MLVACKIAIDDAYERFEEIGMKFSEKETMKDILIDLEYCDEEDYEEDYKNEYFGEQGVYRFILTNGDTVEVLDDGENIICICDNKESAKLGALQHYLNSIMAQTKIGIMAQTKIDEE